MMNSFNLTLSEKHFIFPSILNDSFAGYSNLGCRSLRLILGNVIMMCLGVFLLGSSKLYSLICGYVIYVPPPNMGFQNTKLLKNKLLNIVKYNKKNKWW